MKKNIFIFIAILALTEVFVAYLFENNKDIKEVLISTDENVITNTKGEVIKNDYYLYNVCIDVSNVTGDAKEKEQSKVLAEKLRQSLTDAGFGIGTTNSDLLDNDRAVKASKYDIAITLAADGGYDFDADEDFESGIIIYTNPDSMKHKESLKLGSFIGENLDFSEMPSYADRMIEVGRDTKSYPFLNYCGTVAVLVDYGCHTQEINVTNDEDYLKQVANGITEGIKAYADANPIATEAPKSADKKSDK